MEAVLWRMLTMEWNSFRSKIWRRSSAIPERDKRFYSISSFIISLKTYYEFILFSARAKGTENDERSEHSSSENLDITSGIIDFDQLFVIVLSLFLFLDGEALIPTAGPSQLNKKAAGKSKTAKPNPLGITISVFHDFGWWTSLSILIYILITLSAQNASSNVSMSAGALTRVKVHWIFTWKPIAVKEGPNSCVNNAVLSLSRELISRDMSSAFTKSILPS